MVNEVEQSEIEGQYLLDGQVTFDVMMNEITHQQQRYKLAYTEAKTLHLLINSNGEIVSREAINEFAWEGRIVTDASLAKSISNLRKVLRECGLHEDAILTIPRVGYRFTLPVEELPPNLVIGKTSIPSGDDDVPRVESNISEPVAVAGNRRIGIPKLLPTLPAETTLRIVQIVLYIASGLLSIMAIYNYLARVDLELNRVYVAEGYRQDVVRVGDKQYNVIKNKDLFINQGITDIISSAPDNSTVFYRENDGIVNMSFYVDGKASSFTFKTDYINKARCVISQRLAGENNICVQ